VRLELDGVAVGDAATPALPALDAVLTDGAPTLVAVGTERGPVLASLIAAGRMRPDRGSVRFDGGADEAALRRAVALVDTPVVAEPPAAVRVAAVVAEELRFAGLPSGRAAVTGVLDDLRITPWRRAPMADLPPTDRIRLLLTLAAARPGVRALVLTSPERHGAASADWLGLARSFTDAGTPVLVIGGRALDPVLRSTGVAAAVA
jgi:ABC-2 type transport system ATP-binding protein